MALNGPQLGGTPGVWGTHNIFDGEEPSVNACSFLHGHPSVPVTDAGWYTLDKGRFSVHTWIVILGGVILPVVLGGILLTL